jgi:hypothetical protein
MLLERFIAEQEDKERRSNLFCLPRASASSRKTWLRMSGRASATSPTWVLSSSRDMAATRQPSQPQQQPQQPPQVPQAPQQGAADPTATLQQLRTQLTQMGLGSQFDGHLKGLEQAWQQHQAGTAEPVPALPDDGTILNPAVGDGFFDIIGRELAPDEFRHAFNEVLLDILLSRPVINRTHSSRIEQGSYVN